VLSGFGRDAIFRVHPFFSFPAQLHPGVPLSLSLSQASYPNTVTPPTTPLPPVFKTRDTVVNNMSSPSKRSTRSSATPSRNTRSSQPQSSPAPGPSNAAERTPRQTRSSQLASSPLFYQSSSPAPGANRASSPLRQMSNSQATASQPNAPSSPLRQQTETQSTGDRTPRASGALIRGEN
jgi:hypothetical protein